MFALMESKYDLRLLGTCRANRKGFDYEQLLLYQKYEIGTLKNWLINVLE